MGLAFGVDISELGRSEAFSGYPWSDEWNDVLSCLVSFLFFHGCSS
ncbi:uncharacterized protein J3R85_017456 [Psidium guajava]|nr:uncharacterized protein J3R85_017456 [Psidium guajava]